jgi:hypothetical protein
MRYNSAKQLTESQKLVTTMNSCSESTNTQYRHAYISIDIVQTENAAAINNWHKVFSEAFNYTGIACYESHNALMCRRRNNIGLYDLNLPLNGVFESRRPE